MRRPETPGKFVVADVDHDSHAVVNIDVQLDERGVKVDLDDCDRTSCSCSIAPKIDDVAGRPGLKMRAAGQHDKRAC